MAAPKNILITEDDFKTALLYKNVLTKNGFNVDIATNGEKGLASVDSKKYHVIMTDWMMPIMDGIEMVRAINERFSTTTLKRPYIVMLTSLVSDEGKRYALESGADLFLKKPIDLSELVRIMTDITEMRTVTKSELKPGNESEKKTERKKDKKDEKNRPETANKRPGTIPPFPACFIASSTGGPRDVVTMLSSAQCFPEAAYFLVQHGPKWMLEALVDRITEKTSFKAKITEQNETIKPGILYVAANDKHTVISDSGYKIVMNKDEKENFVRPSADPLFRSAAKAFGEFAVGIVMTGLGRDGTDGARKLQAAGGKILVQDPELCVAPAMPQSVIEAEIKCEITDIPNLAHRAHSTLNMAFLKLQKAKK